MKRLAVMVLWVAGFLLVTASFSLNSSFDSDGLEVTTATTVGLPSSPFFVRTFRNVDSEFHVNLFSRPLLAVLGGIGCCYLASRLGRRPAHPKPTADQKDHEFSAEV